MDSNEVAAGRHRYARLYEEPLGVWATDVRALEVDASVDRERVLLSEEFRRLGSVTQVVLAADEGHLLHNRLTHSLLVASTARRIASRLQMSAAANHVDYVTARGGLDENVVEAAALAHDLGHPPFGHIGEEELDRLVREYSPDGFEGNAQSFRIVTYLSVGHGGEGLNLTRATLRAILKYPWQRGRGPAELSRRKFGAYLSETASFEFASDLVVTGSRSLEAEVMDWADDIAYCVHDVADFFRAHWIPLETLAATKAETSRAVQRLFDNVRATWSTARGDLPSDEEMTAAAGIVIEGFPFSERYDGSLEHRRLLSTWSAVLGARYRGALSLGEEGLLAPRPPLIEIELLKSLTRHYVWNNPSLGSQQVGLQRIIRELFGIYMEALDSGKGNVFSYRIRGLLDDITTKEEAARGVCDYVASMTEVQAIRSWERMTGARLGPMTDPAVS